MPVEVSIPRGQRFHPVAALIDTGANRTVITPRMVKEIGLIQVSEVKLARVGGAEDYPTYAATIRFPKGKGFRGFAPVELLEIVGCELPHHPVECLLGRDILSRWVFHYDGRMGEWTIEQEDTPVPVIQPDV